MSAVTADIHASMAKLMAHEMHQMSMSREICGKSSVVTACCLFRSHLLACLLLLCQNAATDPDSIPLYERRAWQRTCQSKIWSGPSERLLRLCS